MIPGRPVLPVLCIDVSSIDFSDSRYNISKPVNTEILTRSITSHGLLEYPVVMPSDGKHVIVAGHNRLSIIRDKGDVEVPCRVMDTFDMGAYIGHATLKMYRGEVGPMGRLKLYRLVRGSGTTIIPDAVEFARKELGIPDFLLIHESAVDALISMPYTIVAFADSRDVNYRVLREVAAMPGESVALLSSWLDEIPMRVNIFRDVVEILSEIHRRDGTIENAAAIELPEIRDPRGRENSLHASLMALRYPRYSAMKEKADSLMAKLRGKGIDVTFPPYFEGDSIGLTVKVSKKEGPGGGREKLGRVDPAIIGQLLDLL